MDATEVFNGVVLRPTPRAVAERGGPTLAFTRPGQARRSEHIDKGWVFSTLRILYFCLYSSDDMEQEVSSGPSF